MLSSLNLSWFLGKGFCLALGDIVSNPFMGEMSIRNDWDKDVANADKQGTTITSFAIRAFSEHDRRLGMPMRREGDAMICHPDIDILISLQNMEIVYE